MKLNDWFYEMEARDIKLKKLWQTDWQDGGRFRLTCYQTHDALGEYKGNVIVQELSNNPKDGADGLLTFVMVNANSLEADVKAILA